MLISPQLIAPTYKKKAAGGGGGATPAVYQNNVNNVASPPNVINAPAGLAAGDLLVAMFDAYDGVSVCTPPAGWTLAFGPVLENSTGQVVNAWAYFKIAGSSEPSSYSFGFTNTGYTNGILARFTGANAANPIQVSVGSVDGNHGVSGTTRFGKTINIDQDGTLPLLWTPGWGGTPTTPAGFTLIALNDGVNAAYYGTGQNTGTYAFPDVTQSSGDAWCAIFMGIVPA